MDNTTPKVSFIPKGTLVRETPFLERRRPRSAIGVLATLTFIASVGGYAGLYFWSVSLDEKIAAKTDEIDLVQKQFSDAPQINRAQVFSSRAELAKELLDGHTVVSPIFTFLSKYTIESVFYDKFSFVRDADTITLELSGEAPTYAALAYQGDVLRKRTKELSDFTVSNVSLTKFGTVAFNLLLTFTPDHLSYSKSLSRAQEDLSRGEAAAVISRPSAVATTTSTSTFSGMSTSTAMNSVVGTATEEVVAVEKKTAAPVQKAETSVALAPAEKQSVMSSFWSRFKFW